MGITEDYREFQSRKGYEEFFQEVRASGQNWVTINAPEAFGSKNHVASRTYVPNPDVDFKVNDFILNGQEFKGRWTIMPVANLQEYRDNTDKRSYRVALRRQQIVDYRRLMTKEGTFMPFMVFDPRNQLWLSGRHRSEAGKNAFDAFFAVVLFDLTPEEELYITDIANQWHQESWTEDERALLALDYMLQQNWDEKRALDHVKLPVDSASPLLGAMLYRRHNQSPGDRRLIESGRDGHGHPFSLKTLGERVKVFSREAIETYPIERWLYLNTPEAKRALALLRSRTGSMGRENVAGEFKGRETWTLKGDVESRWKEFVKLVQEVRQLTATHKDGVYAPTDDRIFMNYVYKMSSISDAGLVNIRKELPRGERDTATTLVDRLYRTFKQEDH